MLKTLFKLPKKHFNKIVSIFLATYMVLSPVLTVGMSTVFAVTDVTPPNTPSLVSPADGASVKPVDAILDWTDETDPNGPVTYNYKSSWSGGSYGPASVGTTSEINATGSADNTYTWQVQACDSLSNCSAWSSWTVTIDSVAPDAPTNVSPLDNSYSDGVVLNTQWSSVAGATSYFYESYNDAAATSVRWNHTYTTTLKTATNVSDTVFWWRVKAIDEAGNESGWSDLWKVTVDGTLPVSTMDGSLDGTMWNTPVELFGSTTDTYLDYVNLYYRISDPVGSWTFIDSIPNSLFANPFDWSYEWTPVSDGVYDIKASGTDSAGNVESSAYAYAVIYDTTAPNTPSLVSPFDGAEVLPIDAILDWTDETDDNGPVTYNYKSSWSGGSYGPVSTGITSQKNATGSASNTYTWQIQSCDVVMNCSVWSSWVVTIDGTVPNDPTDFITSPDVGVWSNDNTVQVDWPAVDDLGGASDEHTDVAGYSYSFTQGATDIPNDTQDIDFSIIGATSSVLADGFWYFHIRTVDNAGNWTSTAHVGPFIIDTVKPTTSITYPNTDDILTSFTATGTASDTDSGVDYAQLRFRRTDDVGLTTCMTVLATGTWSLDVNGVSSCQVPDGVYDVKLKVLDNAGNQKWRKVTNVTIDNTKPVIGDSLLLPTFGGFINGNIFALGMEVSDAMSGINENKCRISIDGGSTWHKGYFSNDICVFVGYVPSGITYIEDEFGFDFTTDVLTLPNADKIFEDYAIVDGQVLHIKAKIKDNAGNVKRKNFGTWTADSIAPNDPDTFDSDPLTGWTNDNTIEVTFSGASDARSGVLGYAYNFSNTQETPMFLDYPVTQFIPASTGVVTSSALADGTWYFNIRTIDNVGNWTSTEHYGPFYIDTQEPTVTMSVPVTDDVHNFFTALGTATDDDSGVKNVNVEFKDVDTSVITTCIAVYDDGTSGWSLDVNGGSSCVVDEGVYKVWAKAKDKAGNTEITTKALNVTIDKTPPSMPIGLKRQSADRLSDYVCGVYAQPQTLIPDWDDNTEADFSHYEYSSFHPDGSIGLDEKVLYTSEMVHSWVPAVDGTYGYAVRAVDNVGNKSAWALTGETLADSCQITYDSVDPEVSIDSVKLATSYTTEWKVNDNTPIIVGTASDDNGVANVIVTVNSLSYIAVVVGNDWEVFVNDILPDGEYTISVEATDIASNTKTETQQIIIDTIAPNAVYTQYKNNIEITDPIAYVADVSELSFTGEITDAVPSSGLLYDSFVIFEAQDDGSFGFSSNGKLAYCGWRSEPNLVHFSGGDTFSISTPVDFSLCTASLPDGEYYMAHHVYDSAVREDIPSIHQFRDVLGLHFVVDTVAPTDPSVFVTDPLVGVSSQDNTVTVDWSEVGEVGGASDNLSGVKGYSYDFTQNPTTLPDDIMDSTTDGLGDNTVATSLPLSDGNWYFHLRTVDNAGNWTSTVDVGPFVIDNTSPEIFMDGTTPLFIIQNSFYGDAGATAIDSIDGVLTGDIVTVNNVNTAVIGTYSVTYNVSDSAGNIADEVVRTVYVVAPAIPEALPLEVIPEPEVLGVEDDVLGLTCDTKEMISGYIFVDENDNGEVDEDEEVFEGVEVSIAIGDEVALVTTDENGYWEFEACPAEYEVSINPEEVPEGYSFDGEVLSVEVTDGDVSDTNFDITKDSNTDWVKIILWILGVMVIITVAYRFMTGGKEEEDLL